MTAVLPHSIIELIGLLAIIGLQVWNSFQNRQQLAKQDGLAKNQAGLAQKVNGLLDQRIVSAEAKGHAQGTLDEQVREAIKTAVAAEVAQRLADAGFASAERLEEIRGQTK